VPLGGAAGGDAANVNRWRGQVGLDPVSADEIKKSAQAIEVAGQPAQMYELSGKNPGSGEPMGILAAIAERDGTAWFFKMTGDPAVIADQKAAFVEFLKSVKFEASDMAAMPPGHPDVSGASPTPATAAALSAASRPLWRVPEGWQEAPAGQFLFAKFILPAEGGGQATVNVSVSAGDGGGSAANVNRWRKQLGLEEKPAGEIEKSLVALDLVEGNASLIELSGKDARTGQPAELIGVIVPCGDRTWFYKLMGDAKVVKAQRDGFTRLVQDARYL
jgi:hypothetical protein